ncbi:UDP-N-acetylmuramate dehydrogenase [Candidatus Uhrbacteria bacterium]|nr:UDP-N-acetylmuramate dehydrogenase [Candidatus Uhrbacteria bacterium]
MELPILHNEPLSKHTIFQIGGPARYFFRVKNYVDLKEIVQWAQQHEVPLAVLGGGSNVLASDKGFDGLVLKMEDRTIDIQGSFINAGAGAITAMVSKLTVEAGLSGLEWAYGIPGTIGGAVRGNAGAFGGSFSDIVSLVEMLDPKTLEIHRVTGEGMQFQYRRSMLANTPWIVTYAILKMDVSTPEMCKERMQEFLDQKKTNQPLGMQCAGCAFKNVPVASITKSIELPVEFLQTGRVPAGYLVDKAKMKNHVCGRAMVSPKHANFIVNLGGATAMDVVELMKIIKDRVYQEFGVVLEEEIQYIGF